MTSAPVLELIDVSRRFRGPRRFGLLPGPPVQAVSHVSLMLRAGKTLGLVGESGCGKSTVGKLALGLIPPTRGTVRFDDARHQDDSAASWRARRRDMQMIFQDPLSALDPRMRIGDQVREGLDIHGIGTPMARQAQVAEMFDAVRLPRELMARFPHELSGGQQQRAVIARALVLRPKLLVCDEPVSALDVSVQAQVINLLADLQKNLGLAYLFISHDLRIVRHICDQVAVMYLGTIVEQGSRDAIFDDPRHPYTRALISAVPASVPDKRHRRIILSGEPPDPADPPAGCPFHTRCSQASDICRHSAPALTAAADGRAVACHLVAEKEAA